MFACHIFFAVQFCSFFSSGMSGVSGTPGHLELSSGIRSNLEGRKPVRKDEYVVRFPILLK